LQGELIEFLVGCDSVAALAALEEGLRNIPPDSGVRMAGNFEWGPRPWVECVDVHTAWRQVARAWHRPRRQADGGLLSRPAQDAVERLLGVILLDRHHELDVR